MKIRDRIQWVLDTEAAAIRSIQVDHSYEAAVNEILSCRGKILTTGIGKAGYIASKFAATLCSTGTPSVFLHPAEATHGDLGIVAPNDVIVAFSTSGKSQEVLEVLELSHHIADVKHIGITSHPESDLRKTCSIVLDMGDVKESGCPIGITPTSSIAIMLAISDALAMATMECREFTKSDFGIRHHGGYLGRMTRTDNV